MTVASEKILEKGCCVSASECPFLSQYLRLSRNVDQGRILTLCPIMDILCSVGCRLKMTMSPSHMCLSTYKENTISDGLDAKAEHSGEPSFQPAL